MKSKSKMQNNLKIELWTRKNIRAFSGTKRPSTGSSICQRKPYLQRQQVKHKLDLWLSILDIQVMRDLQINKTQNSSVSYDNSTILGKLDFILFFFNRASQKIIVYNEYNKIRSNSSQRLKKVIPSYVSKLVSSSQTEEAIWSWHPPMVFSDSCSIVKTRKMQVLTTFLIS